MFKMASQGSREHREDTQKLWNGKAPSKRMCYLPCINRIMLSPLPPSDGPENLMKILGGN